MSEILSTFIFFFAVIDPIGTVPVFIAVTGRFDEKTKTRIAIKAAAVAALILVFFVVAGEVILRAMSISLPAFQVAGGIVLFLFALTMIFGAGKPEEEIRDARGVSSDTDTAIFPLAIPSLASPGAMLAAVLLTENSRFVVREQAITTMVMLAVLLVALMLMLGAGRVHRWIGDGGASVISRVMGLILASVAVSNVLDGIKTYFDI
jgi:multiple antibiotic resistance protein